MIYITCGHEKSISLEVFLKSLEHFKQSELDCIEFISTLEYLESNLPYLNFQYDSNKSLLKFKNRQVQLKIVEDKLPASTSSLLYALKSISPKDILLTLPTSKDQLILEGQTCLGYTEFLRSYYNKNVTMTFLSDTDLIALVTDHIPLNKVDSFFNEEFILTKIEDVLNNFRRYFFQIENVFISGLNPHAGENGLLGNDELISDVIKNLSKKYPSLNIDGPCPADAIFKKHTSHKDLFVYMYHDQGLPLFKYKNQFLGLNISLGLDFLRMSVDHGTAFELFGKGLADYSGCKYLLEKAIGIHNENR